MKELIKPVKKTEVFENLQAVAFSEGIDYYCNTGTYTRTNSRNNYANCDLYQRNDSLNVDDLLF